MSIATSAFATLWSPNSGNAGRATMGDCPSISRSIGRSNQASPCPATEKRSCFPAAFAIMSREVGSSAFPIQQESASALARSFALSA
jgi:hypothetical protein